MSPTGTFNSPLTPEWAQRLYSLTASAWPEVYNVDCFYVRLTGNVGNNRVLVATGNALVNSTRIGKPILKVSDLIPGDGVKIPLPSVDYDLQYVRQISASVHLADAVGSRNEVLRVVEVVAVTSRIGTLVDPAQMFVTDPSSGASLSILDASAIGTVPAGSVLEQLNGCLCTLLETGGDCPTTRYFPVVTLS